MGYISIEGGGGFLVTEGYHSPIVLEYGSNLVGRQAFGKYDACIFRAARLEASACRPLYGTNCGVISAAVASISASPEQDAGAKFEFRNGLGQPLAKMSKGDKTKFRRISGSFSTWDYELCEMMFGGQLIYGKGLYAGKVIGWAPPGTEGTSARVSLEVVTAGANSCLNEVLPWHGHIFPKCQLTLGDVQFQEGMISVSFTGMAENNPAWGAGPWRDWDENTLDVFPTGSPMVMVGYSDLPIPTFSSAHAGFQDTPRAVVGLEGGGLLSEETPILFALE